MDYIFISKVVIIISLYFLTNYLYKRIDWHARGKKIRFLEYLAIIISAISLFIAVIGFGFIVIFEGSLKFLDSKSYWEQVILSFGLIVFYFGLKIYYDEALFNEAKKNSIIESQKKTILELKRRIETLEA